MVEIPLPNVKAMVLTKVIEYCTHYKQVEPSDVRAFPPLLLNAIVERSNDKKNNAIPHFFLSTRILADFRSKLLKQ
jgi:hypothetical protein